MKPFFSIIIPVYNVAPYLRECLDSLCAQVLTDWEAICVDDGSQDDSGSILDEYAKKDARFHIVHKNNEGVSVARNLALSMAVGEYVGFADADDALAADWLIHAQVCISETGADVVRFELQRWNGSIRNIPKWPSNYAILTDRKELIEWGWTKYLSGNCGGPCNIFARRNLLSGNAIFPLGMRMKEDRIFLLQILMKTQKMICSDYQGYFYRCRNDGACGSRRTVKDVLRYSEEVKKLAVEFQDEINCFGATVPFKRAISWTLINDIEELMEQGLFDEWCTNHEIPKHLQDFHRKKLLLLRYVRPRYYFAVLCATFAGSMKGFAINKKIGMLVRKFRSLYRKTTSI